jgi:hypothetical protein
MRSHCYKTHCLFRDQTNDCWRPITLMTCHGSAVSPSSRKNATVNLASRLPLLSLDIIEHQNQARGIPYCYHGFTQCIDTSFEWEGGINPFRYTDAIPSPSLPTLCASGQLPPRFNQPHGRAPTWRHSLFRGNGGEGGRVFGWTERQTGIKDGARRENTE